MVFINRLVLVILKTINITSTMTIPILQTSSLLTFDKLNEQQAQQHWCHQTKSCGGSCRPGENSQQVFDFSLFLSLLVLQSRIKLMQKVHFYAK